MAHILFFVAGLLVLLSSTICQTNAKCGGRTILKSLQGTISDGESNYPANQQCEWLIEAPQENMTITLEFIEYETECAYDYLFIYDGSSYQSKLLGSFSGNNVPETVVASSGKMLIHLFSDTNYVKKGFKANYTIENCSRQCSGHGSCSNGQCICNLHWRGKYCDLSWCPDNCNVLANQGECDLVNKHCLCRPGFAGDSCSLSLLTDLNSNTWYRMVNYSAIFTPRLGHAAVYDHKNDTVWSFGGFNLNVADNSLFKFNISTGQWIMVSTNQPQPVGRYSHTATLYNNEIFVFGGQFSNKQITNEFWKLSLTTLKWTQLNDSNPPPPLAHHTANVVDDNLYIFGGETANESFTSDMYKYDLSDGGSGWERVKWKSGKPLTYKVMGHSTVYDNSTRSLIVFGGFQFQHSRLSARMDRLHVFHVDLLVWSTWIVKEDIPKPRAFHTSSIVGDYMVVYGGSVHKHDHDETCYDNDLHFFHLKCHKWIPLSALGQLSPTPSSSQKPRQGRYSHVAFTKEYNLFIFGGYSGMPRGDMYAYKLPLSVMNSVSNKTGSHCDGYKTENTCLSDPSCGWCSNGKCYPVEGSSQCPSTWKNPSCPGLCGVQGSCVSCLSWGTQHPPNCGWCVQDSHCYTVSSPQGACGSPTLQNAAKIKGWWGEEGQFLSGSIDKCRKNDFPPGLIEITNIAIEDSDYPDEVSRAIVTNTQITDRKFQKSKTSIGFVYPFKYVTPPYNSYSKIHMYMEKSAPISEPSLDVWISKDEKQSNLVKVGGCGISAIYRSGSCTSTGKYFPIPSKDKKYYIKIVGVKKINLDRLTLRTSWNATSLFKILDGKYLQPYTSEGANCSKNDNCMACMTDASCGWCGLTNQCMSRASASVCTSGSHSQHLVLNATQCTMCADFWDCFSCAQQKYCEWLSISYKCVRKGIYTSSSVISNAASCTLPCDRRKSCSSCVEENYSCAWCEKTSSCFVFSSYITMFPYGECSRWVDKMYSKCKNCSVHLTCKECMSDMGCGWCGSTDNPLKGRCIDGDFDGPSTGKCPSLQNLNDSVAWSYGRCPDINECRLGLHECHSNATCHNIYDSYNCVCNRGFTGDGKKTCNKTCDPPCIHGICKPDYTCLCDLGWKGVNCSIDCGCNGHSTCNQAIGICDQCQDYTHGNHCERCVTVSYGNATTKEGCKKCDCNGHGDIAKGECDSKTGVCFCTDNTMGNNCEQCLPGLLGNPRNGGRCYYECTTRSILTNVTEGDISTEIGSGVKNRSNASCLWVISSSTNTSHSVIYGQSQPQSSVSTITLKFISLNLSCSTEHVDVYDGLPYFILGEPPNHPPTFYKLGSFCGTDTSNLKHITSVMGNLVIIFHGDISQTSPSSGFGAIFKVHRCSDSCHGNRQCVMTSSGYKCICKDGFTGPDCTIHICPNNCSSSSGQGICKMATAQCECSKGFAGPDCSIPILQGQGFWDTLYVNPFNNRSYSRISRLGHSMVVHSNNLWIYGGYSLAYGILHTVLRYDIISKTMSHVVSNQLPQTLPKGRYFHCAVLHQVSMFVYAGVTEDGVSNDMSYFNVESNKWEQVTFSSVGSNPRVAGHTCTLVNDVITIIGGYDPSEGFNNKVYQYNIPAKTWSIMEPSEAGTHPTGLYGHSTVYDPSSQSLFVFGGYQFKVHEVQPSSDLYSLHLQSKQWKLLQAMPANQPMPKIFHTAAMVNNVMIVYGGRESIGQRSSSDLLVYHPDCNYWHTLSTQDLAVIGSSPGSITNPTSAVNDSIVYIFGGLNGQATSSLHQLTLPTDLCQGIRDKSTCSSSPGCSWCEVHYSNSSSNQSSIQNTSCYSVTSSVPSECHTVPNNTKTAFINGSQCNNAIAQARNCDTYSSCSSCLSSYPGVDSNSIKCSWCVRCSGGGKCIDKAKECDNTDSCGISPNKRTSPRTCPENTCEAPSCKGCLSDSKCMWTPQIKWLSESKLEKSLLGVVFPWNCFEKTLKDKLGIQLMYVNTADCPNHCLRHKDCHSCLGDTGGDGGWKECVWSESLGQCHSPSYLPLVELAGVGGRIVRGSSNQCMPPCSVRKYCASCFNAYNCGWCSQPNSNGEGVCMEGGVKGPLHGICRGNTIDTGPQSPSNLSKKVITLESPIWASVLCPLENECANGRDNCTNVEDCLDTPESYQCICKPGYKRDGNTCMPVCDGGCGHGVCVTPNNCSCDFGWTSSNCSIKCLCNNHGRCLSESTLDTCYDCRNNTKGNRCELCSPLFVGNATNNGTCRSCYDVCNKSAYVCMSLSDLIRAHNDSLSLEYDDVAQWLQHGPSEIQHEKECLCRNNSKGVKCQSCIKGHFFLDSYCSPCQCNGHGEECNYKNGACSCQNNTQSECKEEPCYSSQCNKCADGFLGRPWDNRQCFSKVIHLNEFTISSKPGSDVTGESAPLPKGATVSYVIYPRYTNVDIRTTIDVFHGAIDVYVSTDDRTFAVYVNKTIGIHIVEIKRKSRDRRDTGLVPQSEVIRVYAGKNKLNTFVSLESSNDIVHVSAVENRLVLTFPFSKHQLRNSRFYMILLGVGDKTHDDTTGIIYFRQDLSQIDLFVFFSVFFSVFFLVLALCIIAWKVKQFHDRRRIAQVQEREMESMASRPFATYSFLTDMKSAPQSCWRVKRESSRRNLRDRKSNLFMKEASHRPVILPVALQSTEDSRAAVVSVMFQLPSNENSDFQLAFGSVISSNSNQHSIGSLFGYPLLSGHKTRHTTITS